MPVELEKERFVNRWRIAFDNDTVETIARKLGVNKQSIYKWARGETEPQLSRLFLASSLTGYSIHWLLTGEGEEYINQSEDFSEEVFGSKYFGDELIGQILVVAEKEGLSYGDAVSYLVKKGLRAGEIETSIKNYFDVGNVQKGDVRQYPHAASRGTLRKGGITSLEEHLRKKDVNDALRTVKEDEERDQ